jgi:serine/threonine-protein kinase
VSEPLEEELDYDAVEVIEDRATAARNPWPPRVSDEITNPSIDPTGATGAPTLVGGDDPQLIAGRYQLLDLLSTGGMGRVYRARHRDLGRVFALKLVLEGLSTDQTIRERFFREARLASSLHHANIVSVTDFGLDERLGYFLVMELLEGETLRQRLDRGRVGLRFGCDVMDQVAGAVRHVHAHQTLHCDIKPENLFLTRFEGERRQNVVKLLDFGLSAEHSGQGEDKVCGTPPYLAPERLMGRPPTPQSDVYALGMVLYELIAGTLPYIGDEKEVIREQLEGPPPTPPSRFSREPLDERVDALVLRALARDPAERQPSAEAFHYELRAVLGMMGMRGRRHAASPVTVVDREPSGPARAPGWVEAAVAGSPLPFAVIEPSGALRYANVAFLEASEGSSREAAPGKFESLALVRRHSELAIAIRHAIDHGRPVWRLVMARGDSPLLLLLAPRMRNGRVESVHATLIDPAMR